MAKLKRLATKEDNLVEVLSPLSASEIADRNEDYDVLTPKRFGTKYKELLFTPTEFTWKGMTHRIQYNHFKSIKYFIKKTLKLLSVFIYHLYYQFTAEIYANKFVIYIGFCVFLPINRTR